MPTTAVTSSIGAVTAPSTKDAQGSNKLGKDEFLKLLMAQLGNQDPTQPTDSQAFVAQLAQFASVESLNNMSSQLNSLVVAQASANQLSTASLVGKEVAYKSDTVHLVPGQATTVEATLAGTASTVTVTVKDSTGKTVRTIRSSGGTAGALSIPFDGRDDAGNPLPGGDYTIAIAAADTGGKAVDVSTRGRGVVSGVSFADGVPELLVAGLHVKLSDVSEIRQPGT